MIVFHQGLPGSGKSYEAIARRIVPALTQRRPVDAYVEGLDHAKLAVLAGISEDECKELLRVITRDQVQTITEDRSTGKVTKVEDHLPALVRDNALVVLDEAQNFWGNRSRMGAEMTKFITEHRHRGIDIVLMGQDYRDVHATWRRRIELKLSFLKLTAFGTSKRYRVVTERHKGEDQYERVGMEVQKYDPKYFGAYASHVSNDTNTADYKDDRATVLKHPLIRYGMPAALVVLALGGWQAWAFFQPETHTKTVKAAQAASKPEKGTQTHAQPAKTAKAPAEQPPKVVSPMEAKLTALTERYQMRLAGVISVGDRFQGVVEWLDEGARVKERLTIDQLRNLGAAIVLGDGVLTIALGGYQGVALMTPVESLGAVSANTAQTLRPAAAVAPAPSVAVGIGATGGIIPPPEPAGPIKVEPNTRTARAKA